MTERCQTPPVELDCDVLEQEAHTIRRDNVSGVPKPSVDLGCCPSMPRVLLVEDDDGLQRFLCDVLEQEAHTAECVCVRTKAEAEAALRAGRYELVIADVRLPDGSGRDLAALARAAGAKVLLTSGHPAEITLLQVSGVEHLSKPFRVSDLLALLRRHLGP